MADAMLAGLPRLVRVADEVRWRGQAAVSIALAVAVYWLVRWLLDQPVDVARTLGSALAVCLVASVPASLSSGRRLARGLRDTRPPPRVAVYETHADGRERRARLSGVVLLGAVVLLVFDSLTDGGGAMAGLLAGLFAPVGAVDIVEARRWRAAERARQARLYVLIGANALVARYGPVEIYEVPRPDPDREPETVSFGTWRG